MAVLALFGGDSAYLFPSCVFGVSAFAVLHDTSQCVTMLRSTARINDKYTLQNNYHLTEFKLLHVVNPIYLFCELHYIKTRVSKLVEDVKH
jgi:hypothetical protein